MYYSTCWRSLLVGLHHTCTLCKPLPLMKAGASCRNVWYFKENLLLVISAREPYSVYSITCYTMIYTHCSQLYTHYICLVLYMASLHLFHQLRACVHALVRMLWGSHIYTRTHTVQRKPKPGPSSLSHSLTSPVYRESIKSKPDEDSHDKSANFLLPVSSTIRTVLNQMRTVQYSTEPHEDGTVSVPHYNEITW